MRERGLTHRGKRIPSLVAIPLLLCMCLVPESSRYFISRNRHYDAVICLSRMANRNGKKLPAYFTVENLDRLLLLRRGGANVPEEERLYGDAWKEVGREEETEIQTMKRWCCNRTWMLTLVPLCTIWFLNACGSTLFGWV